MITGDYSVLLRITKDCCEFLGTTTDHHGFLHVGVTGGVLRITGAPDHLGLSAAKTLTVIQATLGIFQ